MEAGRELFALYGLKKTSLEDLTRSAGIAKSSFYAFFRFQRGFVSGAVDGRAWRLRGEISAASFEGAVDGREAIEHFLRAVVREFDTNPLMRRIITHPEEWQAVVRRVPPEMLEANVADSTQAVGYFIRMGQEAGLISAGDPEVMAGVIRSIVVLGLHKDDIGREIYPDVLEMMIGLVADGLTTGVRSRTETTATRTERP